jgi:beta-N-acetylhexosaminidase
MTMNCVFCNSFLGSLATLLMLVFPALAQAQPGHHARAHKPCFLEQATPWADSVINTMSTEEKIGQLFMVASWSDQKHKDYDPAGIEKLIRDYHIGGLIFMQGGPVRQALLTNRFQSAAKIPLLIAMDAEWGLGMRLDSTMSFPRQMTMGAIQDEMLVYEFGLEMSRQCKRLGVHVSFSPVVDVNNNPLNPVISNRSFGEDIAVVTRLSKLYMQGPQNGRVLAVAKHFPGHGDTETDSHKDLPVITHGHQRLHDVELYPFRTLIPEGLGGVMTAHLYVPALEPTPNLAATLSPRIIDDLLQREMNFDGLIFTDALNMMGVARFHAPGEADLKALLAGNDVLLFPQNVPLAVANIKAALDSGLISMQELDRHCLKILRTKEWTGAHMRIPVETENLMSDLNSGEAALLRTQIIEESITVLRNGCQLIPLVPAQEDKVAVVCIGSGTDNDFVNTLAHYFPLDRFSMDKNPEFKTSIALHDTLSQYDLVIAAMMNTSNRAQKKFGLSNEAARILNAIGMSTDVVLCVFANPYGLDVLRDTGNIEGLVVAYQDDPVTHATCAQALAGALNINGALPVTAGADYHKGMGFSLQQTGRLRWVSPEYVGLRSTCEVGLAPALPYGAAALSDHPEEKGYREDMMADRSTVRIERMPLQAVDSIALSGIRLGAYPGCRVLAAKDGRVFYDKSFGTLDYRTGVKVDENTLYDVASLTKVLSTTLCVMKLHEEGKLDVNGTLGQYLDIPEESDYSAIVLRDMMAHCAGLVPWIPFWQATMADGKPDPSLYRSTPDSLYNIEVAHGLYLLGSYRDSIMTRILATPVSADHNYRYSDLGYYFLQRIIEKITGMGIDRYAGETFYRPMGLYNTGYCPLSWADSSRIAPTEDDRLFRGSELCGHVHDQGAAMQSGIAGHAGIFSTAQDVAAIMQMLLNGGQYAGQKLLTEQTIRYFTAAHYPGNRRGIGFDKPAAQPGTGPTCAQASLSGFGHTGFTGTMCWADPDSGIVFVFLSNRVHPDAGNKKLQDLNIRTQIQEEIYEAFGITRRE